MTPPRRARRLAAPIVMTAVAAGCAAAEPIHRNPPPQEAPTPARDYGRGNPPPPDNVGPTDAERGRGNPPPPELPEPSGKGRVEKRADGTCVQYAAPFTCPPTAVCNPPPPHPVVCPK